MFLDLEGYMESLSLTGIDHTVHIWNINTNDKIFAYRRSSSMVHAVACSPDGKYIALASSDHTVQIWDVAANREVFTYARKVDHFCPQSCCFALLLPV